MVFSYMIVYTAVVAATLQYYLPLLCYNVLCLIIGIYVPNDDKPSYCVEKRSVLNDVNLNIGKTVKPRDLR